MKKLFLLLVLFINLNAYEVFEDIDSNLSLESIMTKDFTKQDSLNFALTKSTIWLKFDINNSSDSFEERYLQIDYPFLDIVDLYEIDENSNIKLTKNGMKIAVKDRAIKSSHIIFKIKLAPYSKKKLFLKTKTRSITMIVPIFHMDENSFLNFIRKYEAFIGGLLSIIFILIIYNFFIYFYLKERVYLNYILYIGNFFIYQLFYTTVITNYFHIENFLEIMLIFAITSSIFALFFIRDILETKKNLKFLDKIIILYIIFTIFELCFMQFDFFIALKIRYFSLMFLSFLVLIIAVASIYKGVKIAKLFLLCWSFFLFTIFIVGGIITKMLPDSFFISHLMQIGSVTELFLFSLLLAYRVNILKEEKIKAISDLKEKDDILHLQSRFATIGETLCNIEHQWRTPLSKIGVKISRLEMELDYNENPDTNLLRTITKESSNLLQHMSQTVSDFRNFYTPTSNPENFYIKDSLLKVISIMNFFTDKYHINIELKANSNPQFYGYESEFSQVILNIISNANDILLEREISNPKILITLKEIEDRIEITISDNALGINSEVIEQIFAPFYSKKSTKSTGLGLYMSKIIIEKRMLGTLSVKNIDGGTEFKILLINRDTHN